ncbi:MAG: cell division ATP-binding protein FtsE [Firmicutes bacterium]|nr:cell division ATP-binding protein FtsE [Bacillota bacterium]
MIKFDDVTKIYDGNNVGLQNVSIDIGDGDFVFLVGPSGAGKTTFIKLILKELEPDSGHIYINGRDCTRLSNRQIPMLRRYVGMVFQDFRLLPNKTVFENVALAMEVMHTTRRTIRRQVPQVLTMMGIADKADKFPSELAGGEQQRVAIARAIINRPQILIADEPTGNLDPDTSWEIMNLLDDINRHGGTTVVVVTHDKAVVDRMKKRVVAIDNGRVVRDSQEGEYGYDD